VIDLPASFDYDYEIDDEDDWQPGLFKQPGILDPQRL
jgi:hypothetical protein